MDTDDLILDAELAPFTLSVDREGAEAALVVPSDGVAGMPGILRVTASAHFRSSDSSVDISGEIWIYSRGLDDDDITLQMPLDQRQAVLTGQLPSWVLSTIEDRLDASECAERDPNVDITDCIVGGDVSGRLDQLGFTLGISWQSRRSNGLEALDTIYLVRTE